MENREIYSGITTVPPVFVRLDGRAFHTLAERIGLERPFDAGFCRAMADVCRDLIAGSGLNPSFAYTFSDEISLYFTTLPFNGRVEKIDSVTASYAASLLTLKLGCGTPTPTPLSFDARVIPATPAFALKYLTQRQSEAWRNHINAYCQWALIGDGMNARRAADALKGMRTQEMHEMMFARGINLAKTPAWQRRGVLVCREVHEKEGYNPMTGEQVVALRRSVTVLDDLPLFTSPEGEALLQRLTGCP